MENPALRTLLFQMELSRRRLIQPWFSALGLTLGQGQPRILARLLQGDGLTQRELADACALDAATLSRTLDRLEENLHAYREAIASGDTKLLSDKLAFSAGRKRKMDLEGPDLLSLD